MSLGIKTAQGIQRIHSVHVKCDYPVTFLKSIKSLGNSIIVTDIVPHNDWTLTADIKMGDAVSSTCDMLISAYSYTNGELSGIFNAQRDRINEIKQILSEEG